MGVLCLGGYRLCELWISRLYPLEALVQSHVYLREPADMDLFVCSLVAVCKDREEDPPVSEELEGPSISARGILIWLGPRSHQALRSDHFGLGESSSWQ